MEFSLGDTMENEQVLSFQTSYLTRGIYKTWTRLVEKMPENRFSLLAFVRRLTDAWERTTWQDDDLDDIRGIQDVYTFAVTVFVVGSLYIRLVTRLIYSVVYILICLLLVVENVLSIVETLPIYILETVLYGLQSGIVYTAEHIIAVMFVLSYISVIYKEDLLEMKEGCLRFMGFLSVEDDSDSAKSDHSRCAICLGNRKEVAFQPCGHAQFCQSCSRRLMASSKQCPVCRKGVEKTMNIYI